jgi:rhodanese-related sulfurtransferase
MRTAAAQSILKTAGRSLKAVRRLLQEPADRKRSVVTVRQVMVQSGEAAFLAFQLHIR